MQAKANQSQAKELPKPSRKDLLNIRRVLYGIVLGVITSLVYDYLKGVSTTTIGKILAIKLSVFQLLVILVFFIILVIFLFRNQLDQAQREKVSLLGRVEKDLTEFIFECFERQLDSKLTKIIENALDAQGRDCSSLIDCILRKLKEEKYFNFDADSISIFLPDEQYEYLYLAYSYPPYVGTEEIKRELDCYIGDKYRVKRGIAGFTYLEERKEPQKFLIESDETDKTQEGIPRRKAYQIVNGVVQKEEFTEYKQIKNEITPIHSTAALSLFRKRIPVQEKETSKRIGILGVMCVDVHNKTTFQSTDHDELLKSAAEYLSIAIETEHLLKELHQS